MLCTATTIDYIDFSINTNYGHTVEQTQTDHPFEPQNLTIVGLNNIKTNSGNFTSQYLLSLSEQKVMKLSLIKSTNIISKGKLID